jgi:hypothetical protein
MATGLISTIAGSGVAGECGDAGPATAACLSSPVALAMDRRGDLLIVDQDRVRQVDCGPDTDGDGVCDIYDLSDLQGLSLRSASARTWRPKQPGSRIRVRLRATLDVGPYPAADGGTSFVDQARATGFVLSVYATAAPPTPADPPLARVRLAPASCVFKRHAVRCTTTSIRFAITDVNGVSQMTSDLRDVDGGVPAGGPLRVVLDANDPLPLDYQAAAGKCVHTVGAHASALRCTPE